MKQDMLSTCHTKCMKSLKKSQELWLIRIQHWNKGQNIPLHIAEW